MLAATGAEGRAVRRAEGEAVCASIPLARLAAGHPLAGSWRRLEQSGTLPTQSLAFASSFADSFGRDARVELFLAAEPEGGGIAALLPLCRRKSWFARWEMAGAFEPGDALCRRPGDARRLADAIVRDGRPLRLDRLSADSPMIPALRAAMRGKGRLSTRPGIPTPTLELDPSWTDPALHFNSGRRSDFRRAARRAGEIGEVSFEMLAPSPATFEAAFDEAVAIEARSWKGEAGTAIALDPARQRFFRDYFRAAAEAGELRIAFMRIDGRAVAMQMGLEALGRYWLFKISFDEDYGRCSPGTLLMLHTIGWAAERGLAAYEFLGKAEPWIAQLWTREQRDCVRLRTYPYNVRGAVALAADFLVWLRARPSGGAD